jgi:hypothetical protein
MCHLCPVFLLVAWKCFQSLRGISSMVLRFREAERRALLMEVLEKGLYCDELKFRLGSCSRL